MERDNIDYRTSGFMQDIKYTADLYEFLSQFKDKFGHAETLVVSLDELLYYDLASGSKKEEPIQISEDGKSVVIKFTSHKYYDTKGKVTGVPEPIGVYRDLRFLLNKAVEEYSKKFKIPEE